MSRITPPYQLRARFCGLLGFTCPWCAQVCWAHVTRTTYKVCTRERMGAAGLGWVRYSVFCRTTIDDIQPARNYWVQLNPRLRLLYENNPQTPVAPHGLGAPRCAG